YGYDLPTAEPEVYYDVLFNNGNTMLYPSYCVLTANPQVLQIRANSAPLKEALALFLKSFKDAEIVVCGTKLSRIEKNA
uniref:Uncharacterized protein n=1 Tax=Caenorhabditis japonica TaxID=281687 RepID=A0A8R1E7F3_CAEJA